MRIAWFLNLDADAELADPQGYVRSAAMSKRVLEYVRHAAVLADTDDIIVEEGTARGAMALLHGEYMGQAWCPTPRALAALERAGATLPPAPPLNVLRRVNSRQFAAQLAQPLDGARYVTNLEDFDAHVATLSSSGSPVSTTWVVKSAFGFAGRGQKRLRLPVCDETERRWLAATLAAQGGVQVEPWVARLGDFALHGWLGPDGVCRLGVPTAQTCDARGTWLESHRATPAELDESEHAELAEMAQRVASALHAAGYFGPFGVDAYRWCDTDGGLRFNPCSEINARYSMGWRAGMQDFRPY